MFLRVRLIAVAFISAAQMGRSSHEFTKVCFSGLVRGAEHCRLPRRLLLIFIHPKIADRRNRPAKFPFAEQYEYSACERTASEQRKGAGMPSLPHDRTFYLLTFIPYISVVELSISCARIVPRVIKIYLFLLFLVIIDGELGAAG